MWSDCPLSSRNILKKKNYKEPVDLQFSTGNLYLRKVFPKAFPNCPSLLCMEKRTRNYQVKILSRWLQLVLKLCRLCFCPEMFILSVEITICSLKFRLWKHDRFILSWKINFRQRYTKVSRKIESTIFKLGSWSNIDVYYQRN